MPVANQNTRSLDEVARLGTNLLRQIAALLLPADNGKFIAIDVDRGEYEIHRDDYTAVTRLQARFPGSTIYLGRVGSETTYRTGLRG